MTLRNKELDEHINALEELENTVSSLKEEEIGEEEAKNFGNKISSLRKIQEEILEKHEQLKMNLPLSSSNITSREKLQLIDEKPKNAVIVRMFKNKDEKEKKILGQPSGGHLSIEVIHNGESVYISLVTQGVPLNDEKENPVKKFLRKNVLSIPANTIYEGFFITLDDENSSEKIVSTVTIDCSDENSLDTEKMTNWAKKLLEQYNNANNQNDYRRYPYQFFKNNCTTIVLQGLITGGAEQQNDIESPMFVLDTFTTPRKVYNYAVDLSRKFYGNQYEKSLALNKNKSIKEQWIDLLQFSVSQITMIGLQFIQYKSDKLDHYKIALPEVERLQKELSYYDVNQADEIIKITQAVCLGTMRVLSELEKLEDIKELLGKLQQYCLIIRHHIGQLKPSEQTEEGRNLHKLNQYIDAVLKYSYQQNLDKWNRLYIQNLHQLFVNENILGSNLHHENIHNLNYQSITKGKKSVSESENFEEKIEITENTSGDNEQNEEQIEINEITIVEELTKAGNEKKFVNDRDVLFRSYGLHEPCGDLIVSDYMSLSNKEEKIDKEKSEIQDEKSEEIIEISESKKDSSSKKLSFVNTKWSWYDKDSVTVKNAETCSDVFSSMLKNDENIQKNSLQFKQLNQAKQILTNCLSPLENNDIIELGSSVHLFRKIISARDSLAHMKQLADRDKLKIFSQKFYHQASNLVRNYLGSVYKQLYFDGNFSYQREAKGNLSAEIQQLILPDEELNPSITNFIDTAKENIANHKKEHFPSLSSSYDKIKTVKLFYADSKPLNMQSNTIYLMNENNVITAYWKEGENEVNKIIPKAMLKNLKLPNIGAEIKKSERSDVFNKITAYCGYIDPLNVSKPSPLAFWRSQERRELIELETSNKISAILQDKNEDSRGHASTLTPLQKYYAIMGLIEKNIPSRVKPWRQEERLRYMQLGYKAGLLCLLEAFTEGHIIEPRFMHALTLHHERWGGEKTSLPTFIRNFRDNYIEYIQEAEIVKNKYDVKISLVDKLTESLQRLADKPDFKKLGSVITEGYKKLQVKEEDNPQEKPSDNKAEVAVDIEMEITKNIYRRGV